MDPFARKMILGSVAFGAAMLLLAAVLTGVYFHQSPQCSESVLLETTSPDRQWTAAVMERRCGDESPFFIHVNLRPSAAPIRRDVVSGRAGAGEVFVAEEDTQGAQAPLEWVSSTQLTIRCPRCRAAEKIDESWGPVQIRYEGPR